MGQNGPTALFLVGTDLISLDDTRKPILTTLSVQKGKDVVRRHQSSIVWRNIIAFVILHALALYGLYIAFTSTKLLTLLFLYVVAAASAVGVTAGAHRLWAHRCYKAKWPLRLILVIFQTIAFQNHIYEWVRDHRVHHKFTDTDADPHNSKRGFFFSHIGWLMTKKHKDVITKGKTVDMSDLEKDPLLMWQKRYYGILVPLFTFILPACVPWYFWDEKWWTAFLTVSVLRYTLALNCTWLVNSAAHIWGMKPYDKRISAAENITVAALTFGEGWHNYHHAFPWDYKAAELGAYGFNFSTAFIDFFAKIGWAYDLKMATPDMVTKRAMRTGDRSYKVHEPEVWGWDDVDMSQEDKEIATIMYKIQSH